VLSQFPNFFCFFLISVLIVSFLLFFYFYTRSIQHTHVLNHLQKEKNTTDLNLHMDLEDGNTFKKVIKGESTTNFFLERWNTQKGL